MQKSRILSYLTYGTAAAGLYAVPVIFFLNTADYTNTWLLFLGSLFFLFIIVLFLSSFNKKRKENASAGTMIVAGNMVTITGVIISVLLCFLLLLIFVPGFLSSPVTGKVLQSEPANIIKDKTGGLAFMIFMTATVGNFSAGFFVTIIFPFVLKKDQTKEEVPKRQTEL